MSVRPFEGAAGDLDDGAAQCALPLIWLAPGFYSIEVSGKNANGTATERLAFEVQ